MKQLIIAICFTISFCSCEKPNDFTKILGGNPISSIAFDSHGTAWIGTHNQGIIKYSSGTATYYNSSNSTFQDSSIIYTIKVDSKDNVWIGGHALTKFNGKDFITYNSNNSPIPEDWIHSIAIDSKDNVWFTSCRYKKGGIVKFDGINWTVYTPNNSIMPVNFVQSLTIDLNDNVWLALEQTVRNTSLIKISNDKWTLYNNSDLGFDLYWYGNIKVNSKNQLCGSIDYLLYSPPPGSPIIPGPQAFIFDGEKTTQLGFDNLTIIKSLTIDRNDHLWLFGYGGAYAIYDGHNWDIDYNTFPDIFSIEQSPDNKIWIGTGDGIYIK